MEKKLVEQEGVGEGVVEWVLDKEVVEEEVAVKVVEHVMEQRWWRKKWWSKKWWRKFLDHYPTQPATAADRVL